MLSRRDALLVRRGRAAGDELWRDRLKVVHLEDLLWLEGVSILSDLWRGRKRSCRAFVLCLGELACVVSNGWFHAASEV